MTKNCNSCRLPLVVQTNGEYQECPTCDYVESTKEGFPVYSILYFKCPHKMEEQIRISLIQGYYLYGNLAAVVEIEDDKTVTYFYQAIMLDEYKHKEYLANRIVKNV